MKGDVRAQQLTPLERLELRDALQDRWREQVRQITLLSLARYDRDGTEGSVPSADALVQRRTLDRAIERARARLEELEQAMHRMDRRTYGLCSRCAEPIGFTRLAQTPEESSCDSCLRAALLPSRPDDVSVA